MRKITVFLVILILFNLVLSGLLILDIQAFNAPKTSVEVNIVDINSEELILEVLMDVKNPNGFELSLKDFELVSNTEDGTEIGRLILRGGKVPGDSKRTFSSEDSFVLKNENITILQNKISGRIGVKFYGLIEKTIPFEIDVKTSLEKIIEQISQPEIEMITKLTEIFQNGLNFSTEIDLTNPTDFLIDVDAIKLKFENEDGQNVGQISVGGALIEPNEKVFLFSNGTLSFDALDAEILWLKLIAVIGVKVAGIYKKMNVTAATSIIIPDVKEFVFGNEEIDFQIPVQFKLTLRGILSNIGFKMYNPSNFSLIGEDLLCSIYRQDGEEMILLGQKEMNMCTIAPQGKICVRTNITIPYLRFIMAGKGKILPDWIILRIEGDFYIAGTRQAVPISLNAFVDPNIIRQKSFV